MATLNALGARKLAIALLLALTTSAAAQDWQIIDLDESRIGLRDGHDQIQSIQRTEFVFNGIDAYRELWDLEDGYMIYDALPGTGFWHPFGKEDVVQLFTEVLSLAQNNVDLVGSNIVQLGPLSYTDFIAGDERCFAFQRLFLESGNIDGRSRERVLGVKCRKTPEAFGLGRLAATFLGALEQDGKMILDYPELDAVAALPQRGLPNDTGHAWQTIPLEDSRLDVVGAGSALIHEVKNTRYASGGSSTYLEEWQLDRGFIYHANVTKDESDDGPRSADRSRIAKLLSRALGVVIKDAALSAEDVVQEGNLSVATLTDGDLQCFAFLHVVHSAATGQQESQTTSGWLCDLLPEDLAAFMASFEKDGEKVFEPSELTVIAALPASGRR